MYRVLALFLLCFSAVVLAQPVANHDYITINGFFVHSPVDVTVNDTCVGEHAPCTVEIISQPLQGQSVEFIDDELTYIAQVGYCGTGTFDDYFDYRLVGATGETSLTRRVTIDIDCGDTSPIARDDSRAAVEEGWHNFVLLNNDLDPLGEGIEIAEIVEPPEYGTAFIMDDKFRIQYRGALNYCGPDSFTYRLTNTAGQLSVPATVSFDVQCRDDMPVAVKDTLTVSSYGKVMLDVLANDINPDGDALTVSVTRLPRYGTYRGLTSDMMVQYEAVLGSCSTDYFEYRVTDTNNNQSSIVRVDLNLDCTVISPIANTDSMTVNEDSSGNVDVLANDADPLGEGLFIDQIISEPTNGTATIRTDQRINYTPVKDYCGEDTFTYQAKDSAGAISSEQTVNVNVICRDHTPRAVEDNITVSSYVRAYLDILQNDIELEGEVPAIWVQSMPYAGTYQGITEEGKILYTPNFGSCGNDLMRYKVRDSGFNFSNEVFIRINHDCSDKTPIARDNKYNNLQEDRRVELNVLAGDVDPVNQGLSIHDFPQAPSHGTVTIKTNQRLNYMPDKDYCGTDNFSYRAIDGDSVITNEATVNLTINCVDDVPTAVQDDIVVSSDQNTLLDIVVNDINPDDTDVQVVIVSPLHTRNYGGINQFNQVMFKPDIGQCETTAFTYKLRMADGTETNTVRVDIEQACIDDAPIALDDQHNATEDTVAYIDILNNDRDPDLGQEPVFDQFIDMPANGTVTFEPISQKAKYTPAANVCGVSDEFTYQLKDATGLTAQAKVVINTITCVEDHPEVNDDVALTYQNTPIVLDPLANDFEGDGERMSIIFAQGGNGEIEILNTEPQTLRFTPNAGFCGEGVILYRVVDPVQAQTPGSFSKGYISMRVSCGDPGSNIPRPAAPTINYASELYTLSWAEDNNADTYRLQTGLPDGTSSTVDTVQTSGTIVGGPGQIKRFRIAGCNSSGCSDFSVWTNWAGSKPNIPAAPEASADSEGQLIQWSAVRHANTYHIQLNYANAGWIDVTATGMTEFRHNSALTDTREYRISACNLVGCSDYSANSNTIGGPVPAVPAPPVAAIINGCQNITWTPTPDSTVTKLQMKFNDDPWIFVNQTYSEFTHCSSLTGERVYRIAACNTVGCSAYSTESNTIGGRPPSTPTAPVATQNASGQRVVWTATPAATSYDLEINFNGGGWAKVTSLGDTLFEHSSQLAGFRQYRVSACNQHGCSNFSEASNVIALESQNLAWLPAVPVVGQILNIVGIDSNVVECAAVEDPSVTFAPAEPVVFYRVISEPLNQWECKNADGAIIQDFTAPLTVERLPAPPNIQVQQ